MVDRDTLLKWKLKIYLFRLLLILGVGIFSPTLALSQNCTIELPTDLPGKPSFILSGCTFKGNLKVTGPHYMGRFILDLHELTSGDYDLDHTMRTKYFHKHRYTTFSIIPFDSGDKSFKGLLRLNGTSKIIRVDILKSSKDILAMHFSIDLNDYYNPSFGWELVNHDVGISLELSHGTKKRSNKISE